MIYMQIDFTLILELQDLEVNKIYYSKEQMRESF